MNSSEQKSLSSIPLEFIVCRPPAWFVSASGANAHYPDEAKVFTSLTAARQFVREHSIDPSGDGMSPYICERTSGIPIRSDHLPDTIAAAIAEHEVAERVAAGLSVNGKRERRTK